MLPDLAFTAIARKARADRDPASTSHTVTANSCIPIVAKACLNHANSLKSMALGAELTEKPKGRCSSHVGHRYGKTDRATTNYFMVSSRSGTTKNFRPGQEIPGLYR